MKRRTRLLLAILCLSLVFLLFQIHLLRNVSKQSQNEKTGSVPLETAQVNIGYFAELCQQNSVPVILVDPDVLETVINASSVSTPGRRCRFLCAGGRKVTVFAALSTLWMPQAETIIDALHSQHFEVLIVFPYHRPPTDHSKMFPTHYVIQRHLHSIHLVIFYERSSGYWWHGELVSGGDLQTKADLEKAGIDAQNLSFGKYPGAYDKFEQMKVNIDGINLRAPRYPEAFLHNLRHSRFIPCNHTRATAFYSTYGQDTSEEAQQFKKEVIYLLKMAKKALDGLGVTFWLSSGTCLGWYRQCDVIPYSIDVDLGIWVKDYHNDLVHAMRLRGLPLRHRYGKLTDSYELSFHSGEVKLDLFFFYEETEYVWNGGTEARNGKKYKYTFPKFSLCWTEFLEMKFQVPCDTQTYIEANYGKN